MFSVCVPYRRLETRPRFLGNCLMRLNETGFEICIGGEKQEGRFNRAAALNEAISKASREWIIAMDVDLIWPEDFIKKIKGFLDKRTYLCFLFVENGEARLPGTAGGLNIFHKSLWEAAEKFCEEYIGYGWEDFDFCNRVLAKGFEVRQTEITIEHIPHEQIEGIFEDLDNNRKIYESKWGRGEEECE